MLVGGGSDGDTPGANGGWALPLVIEGCAEDDDDEGDDEDDEGDLDALDDPEVGDGNGNGNGSDVAFEPESSFILSPISLPKAVSGSKEFFELFREGG